MKTEIIHELVELNNEFEKRWLRKVDYSGIPDIQRDKMLMQTLRRIVMTGETFLDGAKHIRDITCAYNERLMEENGTFGWETTDAVFTERCPLCGNVVRFKKINTYWEYKCDTPYCFESDFHGL